MRACWERETEKPETSPNGFYAKASSQKCLTLFFEEWWRARVIRPRGRRNNNIAVVYLPSRFSEIGMTVRLVRFLYFSDVNNINRKKKRRRIQKKNQRHVNMWERFKKLLCICLRWFLECLCIFTDPPPLVLLPFHPLCLPLLSYSPHLPFFQLSLSSSSPLPSALTFLTKRAFLRSIITTLVINEIRSLVYPRSILKCNIVQYYTIEDELLSSCESWGQNRAPHLLLLTASKLLRPRGVHGLRIIKTREGCTWTKHLFQIFHIPSLSEIQHEKNTHNISISWRKILPYGFRLSHPNLPTAKQEGKSVTTPRST